MLIEMNITGNVNFVSSEIIGFVSLLTRGITKKDAFVGSWGKFVFVRGSVGNEAKTTKNL